MMRQSVKQDAVTAARGPYVHPAPARPSGGWRGQANCRPETAHLFFKPDGEEPPKHRRQRIAAAKAVCAPCPVKNQCYAEGEALGDKDSIRAGRTPIEREGVASRWVAPQPQSA